MRPQPSTTTPSESGSPPRERLLPRRPSPPILLLLATWTALAAWAVVHLAGTAQDDFYISFTYAQNLVSGDGFVFNRGERVFGLTNPGWTLLVALVHFVSRVPIDALATGLSGLSLLGLVILLFFEARRHGRGLEAGIAGTVALLSARTWGGHGGAWAAQLLTLAWAAQWAARRPDQRLSRAGLLAGWAVWMRPDALVGVAWIALDRFIERRRLPWAFGLAALTVIGAGLAMAWLYFGAPLPNTLGAKSLMSAAEGGRWSGPEGFWARAAPILSRGLGTWWLLLIALGLAGLPEWMRVAGPSGRLVIVFGALLAVAYPVLGVPFFGWYAAPTLFALHYGAFYLVGSLARQIRHQLPLPAWVRTATAVGLVVALLGPPLADLIPRGVERIRSASHPPHMVSYRKAARWLEANSPEDARIAYVEIGALAYFSRRHVTDLLGLVTPAVLPYVEQGDLVGAFLVEPTEYVLFHSRGRMAPIVTAPWFDACYERVHRISEGRTRRGKRGGLTIYRLREGVANPPSCGIPPDEI